MAAGFAWYERKRPDARIVALVATLAAFAALGRIAFAALPNVKPTTDIVLISGYALGAGPGFVVGALAALVSNFFFGQGPWTPWQMAGWGLTGLIGAGLAVVTRRRAGGIGRWPLALSCAAVGFAFTVLQDVGDWITYSDHSVGQLGVYVGKGLGCAGARGRGGERRGRHQGRAQPRRLPRVRRGRRIGSGIARANDPRPACVRPPGGEPSGTARARHRRQRIGLEPDQPVGVRGPGAESCRG